MLLESTHVAWCAKCRGAIFGSTSSAIAHQALKTLEEWMEILAEEQRKTHYEYIAMSSCMPS